MTLAGWNRSLWFCPYYDPSSAIFKKKFKTDLELPILRNLWQNSHHYKTHPYFVSSKLHKYLTQEKKSRFRGNTKVDEIERKKSWLEMLDKNWRKICGFQFKLPTLYWYHRKLNGFFRLKIDFFLSVLIWKMRLKWSGLF